MMKRFSLSRTTQFLIAANVALALIIATELLLPVQPGTANAATADGNDLMLPDFGDTKIAIPPIAQFVDMTERPLFFPNRRIPKPKVETTPPPPPAPLRLKLEGIAIAGGSRVAVLRNLNANALVQLAEGESHNGWTLDELTSTAARFSRNGEQSTELALDPAGTGRTR
jgi:hypothetical protein